ncbi:MAG TPA: hypothetical protein VM406_16010 [Noviherbaspirillum sp.]|nr:hypothetical protein [Noviherbaspirillum sp.]
MVQRDSPRHLRALLLGPGLVIFLWALWAFIAFVLFDRDAHGLVIVGVTLVLFFIVVLLLRRRGWADWRTGLYAGLFIGLLVLMYMIPIRGALPPDAHALNQRANAAHADRYDYAASIFDEVVARYVAPTREYILQPHRIFLVKDTAYFWNAQGGYVPSHIQAQLYRKLLLASGRFAEQEVELRTGGCVNSPHGYVVIHHPEREIFADLWAADQFEEYRFGQRVQMPGCDGVVAEPEGEPA